MSMPHSPSPYPARPQRRRLIQAGVAGAALFAPGPRAQLWAQTPQGPQLLKLPKVALVIGNSRYRQSPLKNPANDAKAIGETLTSLGFEVSLRLDADRAALDSAVAQYVDQLARRKCVGLFYYAGHGIQLAWKNYLLPVDADLASAADVQRQGFELNAVVAGLTRAANPFNLIILDACRDNPFGEGRQLEQKGLSQMDAPLGSLLAYATAPGNTASDGEGANGLYTENLLREIRVREARVEDVFKRVRLAVRRASKGAQIPWESTSLEDDFYFLPPGTPIAPGDAERARLFAEELRVWESVQEAGAATSIEQYLRRFPSGQFSELAQLRLERLLAQEGEKPVRIAPAAGNPFTAGTARADTAFRMGDTYAYRAYDRDSGAERQRRAITVTAITDREIEFNNGKLTTDLLGNVRRTPDGRQRTGNQFQPLEFAVGKQWTTRFRLVSAASVEIDTEYTFRVTARERVTVPAGSFDCFRVEGKGMSRPLFGQGSATLMTNYWMAPEVCRCVIQQETRRVNYGMRGATVLENERVELDAFKQS
jgi:uncharacterized caspase-like protein